METVIDTKEIPKSETKKVVTPSVNINKLTKIIQGSPNKKFYTHTQNKIRKVIEENSDLNSSEFVAARSRFWLYVDRCKEGTNEEDIKNYIEGKISWS